jgi:hypothetical protein
MKKIAFLDRDGVINKEVNYLHRIDDFEFTYKCVDALRILRDLGYEFIVITNQAGIGRGYYNEEQYQTLTDYYLINYSVEGFNPADPTGAAINRIIGLSESKETLFEIIQSSVACGTSWNTQIINLSDIR